MYLPDDLVREILFKLRSTKSAVRLSSVCKSWRDMIFKNPDLRAKLFNKKEDPILLFHRHRHKHKDDQLEYQIRTRNSCASLSFPYDIFPNLKEIGSCNGILCLRKCIPKFAKPVRTEYIIGGYISISDPCTQVILCNPVTREHREIGDRCNGVKCYGFGYDSTSCDYKVVRIMKNNLVEVYNLSTNCWSSLGPINLKHDLEDDVAFVYLKGRCYWGSAGSVILSFDFRTETFSSFDLPEETPRSYHLGLSDNSLAVCIPKQDGKTCRTHIWVGKKQGNEVSWDVDNCFSIKDVALGEVLGPFGACWIDEENTVFDLKSDGEVVALARAGRRDARTRARLFRFDCPLKSVTFKPSLVSLGRS